MIIPNNDKGIWTQNNKNPRLGAIESSFGLDLSSEQGKLKISPRLMINSSSAGDADLGIPFAFAYNATLDKWHAGCGDVMFVGGTTPSTAFTQDAASTPPTFSQSISPGPDLNVFQIGTTDRTIAVGGGLFILAADGTSWTQIGSLGSAANAPLIEFKSRVYLKCNSTIMGSTDGSTVITSGTYTITFVSPIQIINCGTKSESYIWIGCRTSPGRKAVVYKWDGVSTVVDATYQIDAQAVLAMAVKNGVPYLIDSNGIVRYLNGDDFVEIDRLPFSDKKFLPAVTGVGSAKLVHYNGMMTDKERILMLVNSKYADTNGTIDEKVPSGLWELGENGLFHHASPSTWVNGTTTEAIDYGASRVAGIGAVKVATHATSSADGSLLVGLNYYTSATANAFGIFIDNLKNTNIKAGHFTTPWLFSNQIRDTFERITPFFKEFATTGDKMVVKYIIKKQDPVEIVGTWASTTSFTTTTDITGKDGWEIEVLSGVGGGKCAHITSITNNAGTYTVVVDETFTSASGTAQIRLSNWKKAASYTDTDDFFNFPIMDTSTKVKLKVFVTVTGDWYMNFMKLFSNTNQN